MTGTTGEAAGRYTTKTVRAQERAALADALLSPVRRHHAVLPARRSTRRWRRAACGRISARRSTMRSPPAG